MKSMRDKIEKNKSKVRDLTRFSRDSSNADLSNVDWDTLLDKKNHVTWIIYSLLFITSLTK